MNLFDSTPLERWEELQRKRNKRVRLERLKYDRCPNCGAVRTHVHCDYCGESCPT